ncbi:MAG: alkaline phosphatase family protein, partial [Muribaculaceae bacterium]|nr:alkaline phosphatase family protein [Muribaculaceae bacterium]
MPGIVFALMTSLAAVSMNAADARQVRLLVSIVVDGLDNDYLDLLREHFGDGGFRRLEREGAVIVNADFGTSMDATAATAMIMSGAAPSLSGVAADTRYDRNRLRETPVYTDPDVLGNFTSDTYSPSALRVTTVSDEARIASGGTNVVYAVAPKAGQAIGLGGHTANAVLWLDNKTGNWASSTFYQDMPVGIA